MANAANVIQFLIVQSVYSSASVKRINLDLNLDIYKDITSLN